MNTVPYANARREGRTKPGLIEMLAKDDPRLLGTAYVPNRADLRHRHHRGTAIRKSAASRRLHRAEWPPKPTDVERAALLDYQAERWARRGIRFASAVYYCPCGFRCWSKTGDEAHYEAIDAHEAMCPSSYEGDQAAAWAAIEDGEQAMAEMGLLR